MVGYRPLVGFTRELTFSASQMAQRAAGHEINWQTLAQKQSPMPVDLAVRAGTQLLESGKDSLQFTGPHGERYLAFAMESGTPAKQLNGIQRFLMGLRLRLNDWLSRDNWLKRLFGDMNEVVGAEGQPEQVHLSNPLHRVTVQPQGDRLALAAESRVLTAKHDHWVIDDAPVIHHHSRLESPQVLPAHWRQAVKPYVGDTPQPRGAAGGVGGTLWNTALATDIGVNLLEFAWLTDILGLIR